ncbi:hypothetical protein LUZ62_045274 [Rhynchospora pubera]|uniref:Uncharacterized protein n=1 Tax=Rhynchospora pubera TaxID=906938 RepID=A0AAV8FT14_9POAL|nr:hypothetical protein LUZ62_045274 [Rhynchospora pubera]
MATMVFSSAWAGAPASAPLSLYSFLLSVSPSRSPPNLPSLSLSSRIHIRNSLPASIASTSSYSYRGWDDLAIADSLSQTETGKVDPIRNLLLSVGISDGKSGALFLLGFLSALAVSRARLSPFAFLPVSILVFLAGYAVGIGRDGFGSKIEGGSDQKSKLLRAIISELEVKLGELRNGLPTIGESGRLESVKIRKSIDIVESIRIKLANASQVLENDLNLDESIDAEKKPNLKPAHKRANFEAVATDVVKYFGSLIQENIGELGTTRKKVESFGREVLPQEINAKKKDNLISRSSKVEESKHTSLRDIMENGKLEPAYSNILSYNQEIDGLNSSRLERMVLKHQRDSYLNEGYIGESNESSVLERTLEIHNRSYKFKYEHIGERDMSEDKSETQDQTGSSSISNDQEFNQNLKEASDILTTARECMKSNSDEENADVLLYKASSLLTTAVSLKPSSLLAIGQLGNTYLLHGELKLKISRELRVLLSNSDGSRFKKTELGSALVEVCEECENLLVEAGRNYRKALTIDPNDAKALYNWGLALSFRAQLISDIGPEAAVDADKVYLAAIDKFDAMLSKNNAFAPEALYRWGIALQKRSHLRQRKDKEKIKLLQQAKSLFEEVLLMEANNRNVRDALSSCISELQYHGLWL